MSSAIEVLKDMLESKEMFQQFCVWESTNERLEALKKALLALEKLERVKEITEHWESWYELDENGTGLEDLVDDLKDILNTKKVGEQK